MPRAELRSIGQVLAAMKVEFPDITHSKIRFLESEGLITPHRAPSGYRRFSSADERRLRYILSVQREQYLPLRVIREHLELMDQGLQPPTVESTARVELSSSPAERAGASAAKPARRDRSDQPIGDPHRSPDGDEREPRQIRLDRSDLLRASGLSEASLVELEKYQIVLPIRGTRFYGREALVVAQAAKRLAEYGLDARHLRAIKMSADREVGLVEQAIAPYVRRTGGKGVATEVMNSVIGVHSALLRSAINR